MGAFPHPGGVPRVSDEDFIRTWQEGGSYQDVAVKLGMSKTSTRGRYARLVRNGVPLRNPGIDYESLSELARSLGPGSRK